MGHAQYVNNIGKQINNSIKFNVNPDDTSITNLVLIDHLTDVFNWLSEVVYTPITLAEVYEYDFTEDDLVKINNYINCLKKEMNFYEVKDIDTDCILTEVEEHIIQE